MFDRIFLGGPNAENSVSVLGSVGMTASITFHYKP